MRLSIVLALLVMLGALPAAGKPKPKPPVLEITLSVKRTKVDLLDKVPLTITVRNKGKTVDVPPLRISDNALTIVLKDGDKTFRLRRLHGSWVRNPQGGVELAPASVNSKSLRRGSKVTETLEIIAIRPGSYTATVELRGIDGLDAPVVSRPSSFVVTPPDEGKKLRATIRTSYGKMTAELYPDDAYNTCHEWVLHSMKGFYGNGMIFFRVIENFMGQVGCPANTGMKGYGHSVPQEFNARKHVPGILSMARSTHVDSAPGQFFVMHGISTGLDGKYTVFGKVIEGIEVINRIAKVRKGPNPGNPREISKPLERIELYGIDVAVK
jgi:peptidyl-prolyl cis-trans isomerase B (cyclophilin B)